MALPKFKKGELLKIGDVIGIIAPSSPCEPARFKKGVSFLKSLGFKVKVALDPVAAYGKDKFLFSSDTPKRRANALMDLFVDDSVSVIIAARGAYGSAELLPFLDFKKISKHPKTVVGFSDVTALLVTLVNSARITAVHGPMVSGAFAELDGDARVTASIANLLGVLCGSIVNPFEDIKLSQLKNGRSAKGFITGGSLTTLVSLIGTKFEPDLAGAILFLEEVGEAPYRVHRMLQQLEQAGKFNKLAALILGDFVKCDHPTGADVWDVIKAVTAKYDFPVYSGLPSGHDKLNLAVPFGVTAKIESKRLVIY